MMNDDEEGGIRPLMTNMVSMFRHQSAKHVVKNISAWPGLQSQKSPKVASAMIPWLKTTQYPVFINILFFLHRKHYQKLIGELEMSCRNDDE